MRSNIVRKSKSRMKKGQVAAEDEADEARDGVVRDIEESERARRLHKLFSTRVQDDCDLL